MQSKADLRKWAKEARKNYISCGKILAQKLSQLDEYKKAKNVMLFYPTKYEIDLRGLLEDDKNFYLPRVKDENLLICPYLVGESLKKSCFNILEPCSEPVLADIKSVDEVEASDVLTSFGSGKNP